MNVCFYPLAHVAFYYIGETSKSLYQDYLEKKVINPNLEKLLNTFRKFLYIVWAIPVYLMMVYWVYFSILIWCKMTMLPVWFAIINITLMSIIIFNITKRFKYPGKPLLDGAAFNIAELIFFIALLIWFFVHI